MEPDEIDETEAVENYDEIDLWAGNGLEEFADGWVTIECKVTPDQVADFLKLMRKPKRKKPVKRT